MTDYAVNVSAECWDKTPSRRSAIPVGERQVIAWDTEGMSLSGDNKPQHPVIFGCSKTDPLVSTDLTTLEMLDHILDIDREYPKSLHVGYGWRYDVNMIIKDLPLPRLWQLWHDNKTVWSADSWVYRLRWIPGKWFTVSRHRPGKRRSRHYDTGESQSVTIYDYSSFFGGSAFLKTCEDILRDDLSAGDRETIRLGKLARGSNTWDDLPAVLHYWTQEIQLIRRVMERFRDVMAQAGFALKEWYGPGALANYIIAARKMRRHIAGAQTTTNLMPVEVHTASKYAFAGGRFELFRAGRVQGPIHVWDLNSAYPYALSQIPSLAEHAGYWEHVEQPTSVDRFGVYRIEFTAPGASAIEYRAMPLFMRNPMGLISFPQMVSGWYMSPEARVCIGQAGVNIAEGWIWRQTIEEYPWQFLADMYDTRVRLGKDNLLSLPFKLGPNSIYGKLAQTVGWDQKNKLPPRSHALLIAAWITSYCRATLWAGMMRNPAGLIAVETDSIITTADIGLSISDALGGWSHKQYDEILFVQNGMYHARKGDEWVISKARGLDRADIAPGDVESWLQRLKPGNWEPLKVMTKPRFIGLGVALASNRLVKDYHRVWERQERVITLGDTGKRVHVSAACSHCQQGVHPADDAHPLAIAFQLGYDGLSQPRRLPWEGKHPDAVQAIREADRIEAEYIK